MSPTGLSFFVPLSTSLARLNRDVFLQVLCYESDISPGVCSCSLSVFRAFIAYRIFSSTLFDQHLDSNINIFPVDYRRDFLVPNHSHLLVVCWTHSTTQPHNRSTKNQNLTSAFSHSRMLHPGSSISHSSAYPIIPPFHYRLKDINPRHRASDNRSKQSH
jgi:hypothetical protein